MCAEGFEGVLCETEINECASSPCLNAGICHDQLARYDCVCAPGYTGLLTIFRPTTRSNGRRRRPYVFALLFLISPPENDSFRKDLCFTADVYFLLVIIFYFNC